LHVANFGISQTGFLLHLFLRFREDKAI